MNDSELKRFEVKVVRTTSCWLWSASLRNGYGIFALQGSRPVYAHRAAYQHWVGEIPAGLQLDHLCRVPRCVNPNHLEPVTQKENLRRGEHANRNKTHCKRGHPLSGENLKSTSQGGRACRICERAWWKIYRAKRRREKVSHA